MGIKLRIRDSDVRLKPEPSPAHLNAAVTVIHETDGGIPYKGDYIVTPKVTKEVLLETESKVMKKNVTVLKMPQFEVSNDAGGKTLILGDEYYGQ